jgi:hypothetical protein
MVAAFIRTEIPGSNCAILIKLRAEQRLQGSRIVAVKTGRRAATKSKRTPAQSEYCANGTWFNKQHCQVNAGHIAG